VRPFGKKSLDKADSSGAPKREIRERGRRSRSAVDDSADAEELRGLLREHAREAERSRMDWLRELDDLKRSLRRRVEEVELREAELMEATRRLERSRDGRGRRGRRSLENELNEREEALEKLSLELDERATDLEKREREVRRREQRAGGRRSTS
jgi:hypothetical protein